MINVHQNDASILYWSKLLSSIGTACAKYALPLYVYTETKSLTHVGLQWAAIALVNIASGWIGPRINFFKSDKQAYIIIDILLALFALTPIILYGNPIVAGYIGISIISFLESQQNSFFESLIAKKIDYSHKSEIENKRIYLFSSTEYGKHLGMLIGFTVSYLVIEKFGYFTAFILDGFTYLLSAIIILKLKNTSRIKSDLNKGSFRLLFNRKIIHLSFAQIFAAIGIFIFNAIWIISIKHSFQASDIYISITFLLQYIASTLASRIVSKKAKVNKKFSDRTLYLIRLSYGAIFILISTSTNIYYFITYYTLLNFLIPLSIPGIRSMFQRSVETDDARGLAIARVAITNLAGVIGAILGSFLFSSLGFPTLCLIASFFLFTGALFFKTQINKELKA